MDGITNTIVYNVLNCNYDPSIKTTDSLIALYPQDPYPSLLKLVILGIRDVDYECTVDSTEFLQTYLATIDKVHNFEKINGVSSYTRTLEGLSMAIHSSFYLRLKSYMDVLQNGIDAIKFLREAKELDPTNTDVDFFLGLYDYGRSELKKKLWFALFWYPGNKKQGIEKLTGCSKTARLTSISAALSLSDIYIAEKKPEKSWEILTKLSNDLPSSRFVLWGKTKYFEASKQYKDAALIYERLSNEYGSIPKAENNYFVTRYSLSNTLYMSGQRQKAEEWCLSILNDSRVNRHREIKKDTKKLLEQIHENKN